MRWERLFDDLESEFEASDRDEFEAEVADRTWRELSVVHMLDRLAAAVGATVQLEVRGVGQVAGQVTRVGADWVLLEDGGRRDLLVNAGAIVWCQGLTTNASIDASGLDAKLGLGYALRGIARARDRVVIQLEDEARFEGRVGRVGADFVDLEDDGVVRTFNVGFLAVVRSV